MSPDSPTSRARAVAHTAAGTARGGRFGALPERDGVRFRVLALSSRQLQLRLLTGAAAGTYPLEPQRGRHAVLLRQERGRGDRYVYPIDGADPRPDPASRFQPDGVHGPSADRRSRRVPLAASAVDCRGRRAS